MKLDDIGFYTLSDNRVKYLSSRSPLWRCELILTDRCNFHCPYCRKLDSRISGELSFGKAMNILNFWISEGLKNVRFSGGEPTLYPNLSVLVHKAKESKVERIAVSTNGSAVISSYEGLLSAGVNDFSISLDACCASMGDKMSGVEGRWDRVVDNIRKLSKKVYVTVGIVVTDTNISELEKTIKFAHELGVADIRIISSAQFNKLPDLNIPENILAKHPILRYRVENSRVNIPVRGMDDSTCKRCALVLDDMAVAGDYHFPCIIYLREKGNPIGRVGSNMRKERGAWFVDHDTYQDPICRKNCLDVCQAFNNKYAEFYNTPTAMVW